MTRPLAALSAVALLAACATAQEAIPARPVITDLDFLVGDWAITLESYDTRDPSRGVIASETGTQTCAYDLVHQGEPRAITCTGELTGAPWGPRTYQETIKYNRFIEAFERIGLYSGWPSHGVETVHFHDDSRTLELRGELAVGPAASDIERMEDTYVFDEDYTAFTRRNVGNFPDMPVPEYNTTFTGTGRKQ